MMASLSAPDSPMGPCRHAPLRMNMPNFAQLDGTTTECYTPGLEAVLGDFSKGDRLR